MNSIAIGADAVAGEKLTDLQSFEIESIILFYDQLGWEYLLPQDHKTIINSNVGESAFPVQRFNKKGICTQTGYVYLPSGYVDYLKKEQYQCVLDYL